MLYWSFTCFIKKNVYVTALRSNCPNKTVFHQMASMNFDMTSKLGISVQADVFRRNLSISCIKVAAPVIVCLFFPEEQRLKGYRVYCQMLV